MEKSSALLLRPERNSTNNQIVKACAAQQGVDHIDKFQFVEARKKALREDPAVL